MLAKGLGLSGLGFRVEGLEGSGYCAVSGATVCGFLYPTTSKHKVCIGPEHMLLIASVSKVSKSIFHMGF